MEGYIDMYTVRIVTYISGIRALCWKFLFFKFVYVALLSIKLQYNF